MIGLYCSLWLVMENLILPPAFPDHSQYQSSQAGFLEQMLKWRDGVSDRNCCFLEEVKMELALKCRIETVERDTETIPRGFIFVFVSFLME